MKIMSIEEIKTLIKNKEYIAYSFKHGFEIMTTELYISMSINGYSVTCVDHYKRQSLRIKMSKEYGEMADLLRFNNEEIGEEYRKYTDLYNNEGNEELREKYNRWLWDIRKEYFFPYGL